MHPLSAPVEALIQDVAATIILPRFRNLAASEIIEKSPGDLVTIADRESEARLHDGLSVLLPEACIIGEEACAADPKVMDGINEGLVWLIDPIDGTSNFAEGISPFGVMIALLEEGDRIAAWMFDPVLGRMCHAAAGAGAFVDGERVYARECGADLPIAALAMHFLSPERRAELEARSAGKLSVVPIPRCAAEQYPRLALGQNDISLFERSLPWDHAPGALFLEEAGGIIRRTDGSPYRVGDGGKGLLGASSRRMWDAAAEILLK
jgi:fructose-1,6-bisphosphatase/inositol monophosphatase family enzyme